ncbi:MAG: SRPBCC family protein [Anaerolineae bacterium]|nr:SRPBCC family protein [Anaerolineae bacterium]
MKFVEVVESIAAALMIGVLLPINPLARRWYNRAGATDAEVSRTYPDDYRIPHPRQEYTRAITIHAPATQVYAYLIQLGQERAGMYSYDILENIAGCNMHTVDHIVPEWQTIKIGDLVRFGPKEKAYPVQKVIAFEPNCSLVLAGVDNKTAQVFVPTDPMPAEYVNAVMAYYLEPISASKTRLIARSLLDYHGGRAMFLLWRVTEVLNFVMERKMFATIKRCAERDAKSVQFQLA